MVMMPGVSTEAIFEYYIPPEPCGIVLWTESNRAEYINFIYQERLDATTTYNAGHSVTRQAPMCVCYIGPVLSLEVSSINQPCPAPQHPSTRLLVMFGYAYSSTACSLCHKTYCPKQSANMRYIPKRSCHDGQTQPMFIYGIYANADSPSHALIVNN